MPYINPSDPNNFLSDDEIELLANQQKPPISIQQYKDNNNLKFVEKPDSPLSSSNSQVDLENQFEQQKDFIDRQMETGELFPKDVAPQGASATSTSADAPQVLSDVDLLSGDVSSESLLKDKIDPAEKEFKAAQVEYDRAKAEIVKAQEKYSWNDINPQTKKEYKAAEEALKNANRGLKYSEINLNVEETWAIGTKEPSAIAKEFNSVEDGFGEIGNFSVLQEQGQAPVIEGTLYDGSIIQIPLNIDSFWTSSDKKRSEFDENMNKLRDLSIGYKKSEAYTSLVDVVQPGQVSDPVQSFEEKDLDLNTLNSIYAPIGIQVIPIYKARETDELKGDLPIFAKEVLVGYELLKDGAPVVAGEFGAMANLFQPVGVQKLGGNFEENVIQDWIRENVTPEEVQQVTMNLGGEYSKWVRLNQLKKVEVEKNIASKTVDRKYVQDNVLGRQIVADLTSKGNFTPEELTTIKEFFEDRVSQSETGTTTGKGRDAHRSYPEGKEMLKRYLSLGELKIDTGVGFDSMAVYEGLPEDLKEKMLNSFGGKKGLEEFIRRGGVKVKTEIEDARFKTILEKTIKQDGGNVQETLRLGEALKTTPTALLNKALFYKQESIEIASKALGEIPEMTLRVIGDVIDDIPGATIKHESVKGQGEYYQLNAAEKLSDEDQAKFDKAQVLLNKVQNTIQILNDDRKETIQNFISEVVDLKRIHQEQGEEYKELFNDEVQDLMITEKEDTGVNYTKEEAEELISSSHKKELNLFDALYKEYDTGALMAKDFSDASYGIVLALPTLFNADFALDEQARLNSKNSMYMDMLSIDNMEGNFGLFALRTLSQQMPNIMLAIGTGAGLNMIKGLSQGMAKSILAYGAFGLPAGTEMYRNLQIQKTLVNTAYDQRKWLTKAYNEGQIDRFAFANGMSDATQAIAMGDLSNSQIIGASVMTGMVEGTVTRFIGSATNTMKILKDVKGISPISQVALAGKNTALGKYGLFGVEYLKRTGGELIEESTILLGNQFLSEYAILDRDFNMDQLDDTLMSTLLTAGFSNGPSLAYSAVVNVSLSEKMKKTASEQYNKIKFLKQALKQTNSKGELILSKSQLKTITADISERLVGLSESSGQAGVDAMALGSTKIKQLLHYKQIRDDMMLRAGVNFNTKNPNQVIGQYKRRKLTKDQAEAFDSELNGVNSAMKDIRESDKDYANVKTLLNGNKGEFGLHDVAVEELNVNPSSEWKRAKTPQQKLAAVISYLNNQTADDNTKLAKEDSQLQLEWAIEVQRALDNGQEKPSQEFEDKWFRQKGKIIGMQAGMVITSVTQSMKATDLVKNTKDIQYIESSGNLKEDLKKLRTLGVKKGGISLKNYNRMLKALDEGATGFVVDNKYVVNNVGDAKAMLETGDFRKGVVVLHELAHIQDDKFFGNVGSKLSTEGRAYVNNLYSALNNSENISLKNLSTDAQNIVNELYPSLVKNKKGEIIPFEDRSDTYKDEYSKEVQTLLFTTESELQLEKEKENFGTIDNIIDKVFGGSRYNINTPEKALAYAVGNNAAARRGETSEFTQRGIDRRKPSENKKSIKKSKNISDKNKETAAINTKIENRIIKVTDGKPDVRLGDLPVNSQKKYKRQLTKNNEGTLNTAINIAISKIPQSLEESKRIPISQIKSQYKEEFADLLNNYKPLVTVKGEIKQIPFGAYMNSFLKLRLGDVFTKGKKTVSEGVRITSENVDKVDAAALQRNDKTVDLTERAAKEAKEILPTLKETIKSPSKTNIIDSIKRGVEREVKQKMPRYGVKETVKSSSILVKAFNKDLPMVKVDGKNLYAKVIDDIGGRNKTVDKFDTFLSDNYRSLLEPGGLTTTYLSKAFPQAIEKYIVGEGWVKYPGWKGKKKGKAKGDVDIWSSTESGPFQGSTSGLQKIRRISNIKNVIPLAQFKGKYVDGINNKVKVAPTEALAKQLTQEIGLDIFNEEIQKDQSLVKDSFLERQELLGTLIGIGNFEAQIDKEIERPGIKNSLATLSPAKLGEWVVGRSNFYQTLIETGVDLDAKNIERLHRAAYGDNFTAEQHKGIALQFGRLLKPVAKADKKVFKTDSEFISYLENVATANDTNESIVQFTKSGLTVASMVDDPGYMMIGRDIVKNNIAPNLIKDYGKDKALDMLVAFSATFGQGQEKAGGFRPDNGKLIRIKKDETSRVGLFGKVNIDYLENVIQPNFPNVVSIKGKKITFKDGTTRNITINSSATVQQKHLKGLTKVQIDKGKVDAKIAREFVETIVDSVKELNPEFQALILATINASSDSALRLAAPVWGKSAVMDYKDLKSPKLATAKDVKKGDAKKVGDKMYTKKGVLRTQANYRYEHALPARVVLWYLYDSKINNNKKIDLDALFDDYRVTIIPITEMDDVLRDTGFSSIMLANYIPGEQTWWKRYFNRFTKGKIPYALESYETGDKIGQDFQDYYESKGPFVFKSNSATVVAQNRNTDVAIKNATNSMKYSKEIKKIRVFDFDDTLAKSNSKVLYTMPDGTKGKMSATEFAKDAALMEKQGVVWDFTEFSKVIDGKKGPLFNVAKKIQDTRGSEDTFVLTARPQEAARPIQKFLASIGLNIPISNITGLENGTPKAKADWMVNKFAEGYNDFYFTDDAFKNVKAVKDVLSTLDVKSKVQQARVKFSKDLNVRFNQMIEENKGISAEKRYSAVVAQRLGRNKKRWNFFIPPSADDFRGLTMYMFSGSGKKGEADMEFFNESLILPYTRGISAMETAKQAMSNDYRGLIAGFPKIRKLLRKKIKGTEFTHDEAVRVYLWDKAGYTIPGISKRDQAELSKIIREDSNLSAFAGGVLAITKKEQYAEPSNSWSGGTILSDLNSLTNNVNRKEYLDEFSRNVDIIFSEENLNKIEAVYGSRVKEALINTIERMKTGSNRSTGTDDRIVDKWNDWVNNSIGAIMFFNRRSALLQLISSVNFINWSDNNPMMASVAFANQPQFWKDVVRLFNSDKLKQRRSGLKGDINEAEIAAAVKGARNKTQAFISVLLKYGFTFTQIADSVAISTGGATMFRNRTNTYLKEGFSLEEAESKAFTDFSLISDESQQSADPMLISSQQAGTLGRFLLAFQNTPMQYTRLMKKAGLDLINRRGDPKTNISKIVYYGFIQNLIFSTLSNALFALVPGFEEDDDELTEEEQIEAYGEILSRKQDRIIHGMIDTLLRGSGIAGAVISTIKNGIRRYQFEETKGFTADHTYTIIELANLSPPLGSKLRKVYSGIKTKTFERDVIAERGFDVTIDGKFNLSPSYQVVGDIASGVANIPLDRLVAEVNAVTEALDARNTIYQRIALAMGYRTWDVNAKNEEGDKIKVEGKARRKEEGKIKSAETRKRKKAEKDAEFNALSDWEKSLIQDAKFIKRQEAKMRALDKKMQS